MRNGTTAHDDAMHHESAPAPSESGARLRQGVCEAGGDDAPLFGARAFGEGNPVAAQSEMLLRFLDGDYRDALALAEVLLDVGEGCGLAAAIADEARRALDAHARLAGAVLALAVDARALRRLPLDSLTLVVLRRLDGRAPLPAVLAAARVPADAVIDTLRGLVARGIVRVVA